MDSLTPYVEKLYTRRHYAFFFAETPLFSHGFSPLDRGGLFPSHGGIMDPLSMTMPHQPHQPHQPQAPTVSAPQPQRPPPSPMFSTEGSLFKPTPIQASASPRSSSLHRPFAAAAATTASSSSISSSTKVKPDPAGGLLLQTVTTASSTSSIFRHVSGDNGRANAAAAAGSAVSAASAASTAAASAAFGGPASAKAFSPLTLVTGNAEHKPGIAKSLFAKLRTGEIRKNALLSLSLPVTISPFLSL